MRSGATALLLVAALVGAWAAPPLSETTAAEAAQTSESPACDKEQFRLKFGAQPTYTLLTAPVKPAIQNGFVVAKVCMLFDILCWDKSLVHNTQNGKTNNMLFSTQVSYLSACRGGGSAFSASVQTKANMEIGASIILYLKRFRAHLALPRHITYK